MNNKTLPSPDFNAKALLLFLKKQAQTRETLRILGYQEICFGQIKDLIYKLQEQEVPELLIYCDLFNYGYIEGKRAERRKKHITN